LLIVAITIARIFSCIIMGRLLHQNGGRIKDTEAEKSLLVIASCLPYSFSYWLFSLLVAQWLAIVSNKSLSRNPFSTVKPYYILVNVCVVVLAWAMFILMVLSRDDSVLLAASSVFAILFLAVSSGFWYYGRSLQARVVATITGGSTQIQTKKGGAEVGVGKRLGVVVTVVSCAIFLQSIAFLISALFAANWSARVATTGCFLLLDIFSLAAVLWFFRDVVGRIVGPKEGQLGRSSRNTRFLTESKSQGGQIDYRSDNGVSISDIGVSSSMRQSNLRFVEMTPRNPMGTSLPKVSNVKVKILNKVDVDLGCSSSATAQSVSRVVDKSTASIDLAGIKSGVRDNVRV